MASCLSSHSGTCVIAAGPTAAAYSRSIRQYDTGDPSRCFIFDVDSGQRTPGDTLLRNLKSSAGVLTEPESSQSNCVLCGELKIRAFKDRTSSGSNRDTLFGRFFTLALSAGAPLLRFSDEASWAQDADSGKKTPMSKIISLKYNWQALATLATGASLSHEAACSLTLAVDTSSDPVYLELLAPSAVEARLWAVAISNNMGGIRERNAPRLHELDALALARAWDSTVEAAQRRPAQAAYSDAAAAGDALLSPLEHAAAQAVAAAGRADWKAKTRPPPAQPAAPAPITPAAAPSPSTDSTAHESQSARKPRPQPLQVGDTSAAAAPDAHPGKANAGAPPANAGIDMGVDEAATAIRGGAVFGFATAEQASLARAARKAAADAAAATPQPSKRGTGGTSGARTAPGTARASARRPLSRRRGGHRPPHGAATVPPASGSLHTPPRRPSSLSRASSTEGGGRRVQGGGPSRSLLAPQRRPGPSRAMQRSGLPAKAAQASANPGRTPLSLRLLPLTVRMVPLKLAAKALKQSPQHGLPTTAWGASVLRVYDQVGLLCALPAVWLKPSVRSLGVLLLRLGDSVDTSAAVASAPQAEMARAFLGSGPTQRGATQGRSASAGRSRQHKAVVVGAVVRPGAAADVAQLDAHLPARHALEATQPPTPQATGKALLSLLLRLVPFRQHMLLCLLQPALLSAFGMTVAAAQRNSQLADGVAEVPTSVFHFAPSFNVGTVPPLMDPATLLPGSAGVLQATVTPEKGGKAGQKLGSNPLSPGATPAAVVPVDAVFDDRQHASLPLSRDVNSLYPGDILVSAGPAQLAGRAPKEVVQSMKRQLRGGGAAHSGVNVFLVRPMRVTPAGEGGGGRGPPVSVGAATHANKRASPPGVAHSRAESHLGGFRHGREEDGQSSLARDTGQRAAAQLFPAALREALRSSITPRGSMLPPASWGQGQGGADVAHAAPDAHASPGQGHMTVVAAPASPGRSHTRRHGDRGVDQVHPADHDSDSQGDESDSSAEGTGFTQSLPATGRHVARRGSPQLSAVQFDMGVVTTRTSPRAVPASPSSPSQYNGVEGGLSVEQRIALAYRGGQASPPAPAPAPLAETAPGTAAEPAPRTPLPKRAVRPLVAYVSPLRVGLQPVLHLASSTGSKAGPAVPLPQALHSRLDAMQRAQALTPPQWGAHSTGAEQWADAVRCLGTAPAHMQGSAAYQLAALSLVASPEQPMGGHLQRVREASPAAASLAQQLDALAALVAGAGV